jgi:hypothetical protein
LTSTRFQALRSMIHIVLLLLFLPATGTGTTTTPTPTTATTTTATKTTLPGGSFFGCLSSIYHAQLHIVPQNIIRITDIPGLHNIDTSATAKSLVKITGLPFGLWDSKLFSRDANTDNVWPETNRTMGNRLLTRLASKYGNETVKWHFAGEGNVHLPLLAHHKHPSMFLTFEKAVHQMLQQKDQQPVQRQEQITPQIPSFSRPSSQHKASRFPRPSFFYHQQNNFPNNSNNELCGIQFDWQLFHMNMTKTPLYAFASTGYFMVKEWFNPSTGEIELEDGDFGEGNENEEWQPKVHNKIAKRMKHDKMFSSVSIEKLLPLFVDGKPEDIDLYFATHMSGTHFHTHGATVTSTTGHKLWMFFSPAMQQQLAQVDPTVLHRAGLAPICSEHNGEKYQANSSSCFGQFHSLEILRAYETMQDFGIAPLLLLQRPEEILVLPENWMHATVNLEEGVSVSYRFPKKISTCVYSV